MESLRHAQHSEVIFPLAMEKIPSRENRMSTLAAPHCNEGSVNGKIFDNFRVARYALFKVFPSLTLVYMRGWCF